jgi:hypothetical protein
MQPHPVRHIKRNTEKQRIQQHLDTTTNFLLAL